MNKITLLFTVVLLLTVSCQPAATPTLAPTPEPPTAIPPTAMAAVTPTPVPTRTVTTESFDFENQTKALPSGFEASLGAKNPQKANEIWSRYEIDSSVSHSGKKSLKLSSNINTTRWYALGKQIPSNYDQITVSYFVKGKNIRKEGTQFDNCYVGFVFTDRSGNKKFKTNQYSGTFDWRSGELGLSSDELGSLRESGSTIRFNIFLSKSGDFWMDDLKFGFVTLAQSTIMPDAAATPAVKPLRFEHPFAVLLRQKLLDQAAPLAPAELAILAHA